jgi:hypothetical protein
MPLPAPYASPWKRLGEDGVALLAWLGLKARELWRRNREGLLPLPVFWPRRWPRVFWPLVLVALLVGLGAAGWAWLARFPEASAARITLSPSDTPGAQASPPSEKASGAMDPRDEATGSSQPFPGEAPPEEAVASPPEEARSGFAAPAPLERGASPPEEMEGPEEIEEPEEIEAAEDGEEDAPHSLPPLHESPAERESRRLRTAWAADPDPALVVALVPDPAGASLTLRVGEGLFALTVKQRQRLAERWRERAAEEGYNHLLLRDLAGRLRARDALVGRGMILLDPPDPTDGPH